MAYDKRYQNEKENRQGYMLFFNKNLSLIKIKS